MNNSINPKIVKYWFVKFMLMICLLFSSNVFGQTIQLDDLLNIRGSDSIYMKGLFDKQQFYLQKIAASGRVTDYLYALDSTNDINIRIFHADDSSFIITMIVYNFTDEKAYSQIGKALQKSKFALEPPGNVVGYNNAKVIGYRLGKVLVILSKFDPTIVKGLYCFMIERTDFRPNGLRR